MSGDSTQSGTFSSILFKRSSSHSIDSSTFCEVDTRRLALRIETRKGRGLTRRSSICNLGNTICELCEERSDRGSLSPGPWCPNHRWLEAKGGERRNGGDSRPATQ